jgi:hypothetical protein
MQLTAKLKNKSTAWSALLKVRVLDVVSNSGNYYQNVSGINGSITDASHWFPIFSPGGSTALQLNKTSTDITGEDPDFQISLSLDGVPAFPASMNVYISTTGLDADYAPVSPVNYNPVTKILHGMNDPLAFPDQKVKVVVI